MSLTSGCHRFYATTGLIIIPQKFFKILILLSPLIQGKFVQIDSGNPLTTTDIIQRIILNRLNYERRNKAKEAKEVAVIKKMKQMEEDEKKQEEVFKMD